MTGRDPMMGEETFHPDTRALLAYGRALAASAEAPKKSCSDRVLDRLFVLERTKDGRWPLRSFGAELVRLFGRDLKERCFAGLWIDSDRALMAALIDACAATGEPGIVRVQAETSAALLAAEILIAPLRVDALFGERFLGLFQPLGGEAFLEGRPVMRLRVGSLHPPFAKAPRNVRLVIDNSE